VCGQNVELLNVKLAVQFSNHWAVKSQWGITDFSEEHSGTAKHMAAAPQGTVSNTSARRAIWHDASTARNLHTEA
jgi:hypothetical protein